MTESISADLFRPSPVSVPRAKPRSRQSQLGQYLTPDSVSTFMAGLFPALPPSIQLLDAGAGAGALTTAFVKRWQEQKNEAGKITAHAYELDAAMLDVLHKTADELYQPRMRLTL